MKRLRTQFGKQTRESSVCVLCGKAQAVTKEHIPPRGLFITLPEPYLKVPACTRCNNRTTLADQRLQEFMSGGGGYTPEGMEVWRRKVRPRLAERPATRAGLADNMGSFRAELPGVGSVDLPALRTPAHRVVTSVMKLVRGLYWWHTGEILPRRARFVVTFLNFAQVKAHFDDPENLARFRMTGPGIYVDPAVQRVFVYFYGIAEGLGSLWYYFFYRQNVVIAIERHGARPS